MVTKQESLRVALSAAGVRRLLLHPAAKPLVFVLCLLPFVWLTLGAASDRLGANPAEVLIRSLGDWALRFLCLTLAVTPLRVLTQTPQLVRFRRMLGLYVFFYASLHLLAYAWLDMGLDASDIGRDILKRPFILMGLLAWLALVPLAATSFNAAIRYLGSARWQALHRLVYVAVCLALVHFLWMRAGKRNFGEVAVYAAIVGVLLIWRMQAAIGRRRQRFKVAASRP
ncbi:MAG TPA: protein-methionine-sulfoxide reductase heme-binding subunit MsrQ [Burkholderiaceae bacterium]|nr:protein-methionine-sulfoxide reductase heme-binding subunit MsrQ [Burkholderiaceae bacterium]